MQLFKNITKIYVIGFVLLVCQGIQPDLLPAQNIPFPQSLNYPGCIKPNHVTQDEMNAQIQLFYDYWKAEYVEPSNGTTPGGGYFVRMNEATGGPGTEKTTSEAHGYGMIIFALMAGHDSQAKQYFDGMYNMFDKHRSTENNQLMSWIISESENSGDDSGSATDGDMDIAYALLLAHAQWGSSGNINYLQKAQNMILLGIKASEISSTSKRVCLGDWNSWVNPPQCYYTRSSDWMAGHLRAYFLAVNDAIFTQAADQIYSLITSITANYSPATGLMPDFVINQPPQPAYADFLEGEHDGDYYWNACRYPWRIAMDYAHYQTAAAKTALNKLVNWVKTKHPNPEDIKAGYKLNGNVITGIDFSAMAFTAPIISACIVDNAHQNYLNNGWDIMVSMREWVYEDSLNLLNMLFISGNWWKPNTYRIYPKTSEIRRQK